HVPLPRCSSVSCTCTCLLLFFSCCGVHRDLHSFPTRRSSDLRLWTLAESLGSVKSLFCHPATMTHASVEPEVRRSVGIGDGLIRDRKSTRLNSSHGSISYAVFCLKKKIQ